MERLLMIDNDGKATEELGQYLTREGFCVDTVERGSTGIERATAGQYDLVLLDIQLPDLNGFEVLNQLCSRTTIPVVIVTARGDDIDKIVGLEMGADDYLAKPCNPRELLARLRVVLRRIRPQRVRAAASPAPRKLKVGDLEINLGTRMVLRGGEIVELTSVEFNLLRQLVANAGELVSREKLIREVLGRALSPCDRSIDVHVSKLRKKLGISAEGFDRIKTIRNEGYIYTLATAIDQLGSGRC